MKTMSLQKLSLSWKAIPVPLLMLVHQAGPRPLILSPIEVKFPITQSEPYSKP